MALPSSCAMKTIRTYFDEGTLPPNEFVCDLDVQPFSKTHPRSLTTLSSQDVKLLEAGMGIGETLFSLKMQRTFGM